MHGFFDCVFEVVIMLHKESILVPVFFFAYPRILSDNICVCVIL